MSADDVFFWANWLLVGALVVGVLSTYAIVVSGNIKEANLKRDLAEKDTALDLYKVEAGKEVAAAKAAGEAAQADAAKAVAKTAEAKKATEELRRQNLELETAIAPRMLQQWPAAEPLKRFAGMQVFICFVPDFEARRLAGQLFPLLKLGEWNPQWNTLDTPAMDGVEIEFEGGVRYNPNFPGDLTKAETNANQLQENAANTLMEVLKKQKIEARVRRLPFSRTENPRRPGVPPDAISIRVGAKPIQYFMDQRFPETGRAPGGINMYGNVEVPPK